MKKFILLSLSFMVLIQCSQSTESEIINDTESTEENDISLNYQGLGRPSEEFVSNWNQLVKRGFRYT